MPVTSPLFPGRNDGRAVGGEITQSDLFEPAFLQGVRQLRSPSGLFDEPGQPVEDLLPGEKQGGSEALQTLEVDPPDRDQRALGRIGEVVHQHEAPVLEHLPGIAREGIEVGVLREVG